MDDHRRQLHASVAQGRLAELELTQTEAAFAAVEAVLVRTLRETGIGADGKILKLHMSLQNLGAVSKVLADTVRNGRTSGEYLRAADDAVAVHGLTRP